MAVSESSLCFSFKYGGDVRKRTWGLQYLISFVALFCSVKSGSPVVALSGPWNRPGLSGQDILLLLLLLLSMW